MPGNHDGDVAPDSSDASLAAFVDNFCAADSHLTPEAEEVNRHAMTQPNVSWTLDTPLATIIGLYTNCPEGGVIQNDQGGPVELPYQPPDVDASLAAYVDDRYGFMRVTVTRESLGAEYVAVGRDGQAETADSWTLDLSGHKVS